MPSPSILGNLFNSPKRVPLLDRTTPKNGTSKLEVTHVQPPNRLR
jgi:hypothetical protein